MLYGDSFSASFVNSGESQLFVSSLVVSEVVVIQCDASIYLVLIDFE